MDEWLRAQLEAGLPVLEGSTASGTLAVREELANELLARWLAGAGQPPPREGFPAARLLAFLKAVSVRAEQGTILIDFQIRI